MRAYTHEVDQREVILDLNIWLVRLTSLFWAVCILSDIFWSLGSLENLNLIENSLDRFSHFNKQQCETFAGSSFLNVRICCFSLLFMTVNEELLGFWTPSWKKEPV